MSYKIIASDGHETKEIGGFSSMRQAEIYIQRFEDVTDYRIVPERTSKPMQFDREKMQRRQNKVAGWFDG